MIKSKEEDRRLLKRRHLIYYLCVFNTETGSLLGHLGDITTEGLMLVSEQQIDAGLNFKFKIELPFGDDDERMLALEGESRWCRSDANPSLYDTGIQFSRLDLRQQNLIATLIDDYGFLN